MWRSVTSFSADLSHAELAIVSHDLGWSCLMRFRTPLSIPETTLDGALRWHSTQRRAFTNSVFVTFPSPEEAKKLLDFNFPCCWTVFPSLSNIFFYFARRSLSCPDWLCNIRSVDELLMRSHFSTLHRRNMNAVVGEIRTELVPSIIKFPTSKRSSLSHTYRAALCNHRPTQAQSVSFRLDDIHSTESVSFFFFSSLLSSASLMSELPEWKKIHQIGVENHILTKLSKSVEHRARNEKVAKILIRVIINSFLVEI